MTREKIMKAFRAEWTAQFGAMHKRTTLHGFMFNGFLQTVLDRAEVMPDEEFGGVWLRTMRRQKGLTLRQLEKETGVHRSTLRRIENLQTRNVQLETEEKLLKFFNTTK